ncbi:MAG: hypothetical protein CMJ32_08185 [Phycisphaerae bacterium]|nr:hypothetical protein [Phycisphaerae bacterium]
MNQAQQRSRRGGAIFVAETATASSAYELIQPMLQSPCLRSESVFDAIGTISSSSAREPITTVFISCDAPGQEPLRTSGSLHRLDPGLRLVMVAPDSRAQEARDSLSQGFDDYLLIPATREDTARVINAAQLEPKIDSPVEPRQVREAKERLVQQINDQDDDRDPGRLLGDVDLINDLLDEQGVLLDTAIRLIGQKLALDDIKFIPAQDAPDQQGRPTEADRSMNTVVVSWRGELFGQLGSPSATAEQLRPWSAWLARWLKLDRIHHHYRRLAWTDDLTGAGNRRAFDRSIQEILVRSKQQRREVSLMVFDIDNFKMYNDQFGHEAGDQVLQEIVQLLKSVIRRGDRVFRIGGDEFVVIFCDPEGPRKAGSRSPDSVESIARRFQAQVCDMRFPKLGVDAPGSLSISAGLATYPWDEKEASSLLNIADQRALESKRAGKGTITFGRRRDECGD